ncbi:MAG: polysaccharide pyruvyl transferase family protein [Phycisphaerales bacterium]
MSSSPVEDMILIAGASPDTSNLGVSALGYSVIAALSERLPNARLGLFDSGVGVRAETLRIGARAIEVALVGLRTGHRYYHPSNALLVQLALTLPFLPNRVARAIRSARAMLDVSGGDSFTDLYGERRFDDVALSKRLALRVGIPLILLPQTYGPYREERFRSQAATLCRAATAAWARDARSFEVLRSLLGDAFDPERHRSGVDVAFLLPERDPGAMLPDPLRALLERRPRRIAGVNVSGLIYNDPQAATSRYGFKADYREAVRALVEALAADDADVLLLPHVNAPRDSPESDPRAIDDLRSRLSEKARERTIVAPFLEDPQCAKWAIARCDWFCGMRMHATIAGLSSGIPTAAISYSPKTLGVFESCGAGEHVVDPTRLATAEVASAVLRSWRESMHDDAARRRAARDAVHSRAAEQADVIASCCSQRGHERTYQETSLTQRRPGARFGERSGDQLQKPAERR